jgi:TRAP-type C4-dicarboxylate transport system permease small subunit
MYQEIYRFNNRVKVLCDYLERFLKHISVVIMALLLFSTLLTVVLRYIFSSLAGWSGAELPSLLLMWTISAGIPLAVRSGSHLKVDVINEFITGHVKVFYDIVINLVSIIFYILLFSLLWKFIDNSLKVTSPMMNIPLIWFYSSMIIGAGLSMFFLLSEIITNICRISLFFKNKNDK